MLNLSWRRSTPVILQTEAAECGLACVAMVAGYHGHRSDLASMRARHAVSLKGATLAGLMQVAGHYGLAPRPLSLDLQHLQELKLPCILHWNFNHFVVLTQVRHGSVVLHDPAIGRRVMSIREFSRCFTGVALELTPTQAFEQKSERRVTRLSTLIGQPQGLIGTLGYILALALVLQVFALVAPFYMQWTVDHAIVSLDRDLPNVLALGFLLLVLMQVGVTALRARLLIVLGTTLNLQLVSRLFRHLVKLPMSWFEARHVGDVMSRFESLNHIQRTMTTSFLEAVIDGVMAIATLVMMLVYSAKLTLVAITAALLYAALRIALYSSLRLGHEELAVQTARQQGHFLESVRAMQSIKLLNGGQRRSTAYQNLAVDALNARARVARLEGLNKLGNELLFGIENVVTVWLGALLVLDVAQGSAFSVGMLFAFVSYKTQFVQRVGGLMEKAIEWRMLGMHKDRVGDIAATAAEPIDPEFGATPLEIGGEIRLEGVSFRYGSADPLILENVDLRIAPGESVAIVGPSGCGKTTLVKLMLGLLNPTAGRITVGGMPLDRIGMARYRNAVASVMQSDDLLPGSIADNIAFFEEHADFARIEECARTAAVHDDITAMPMQYNTLVGDMGAALSGGQRQRIVLARALYRQPRILILDEATSNLDVARERSVNAAVRALNLTRVIVAHRPETIASADRVVVLAAGRVHATVAAQGGRAVGD